MTRLIVFVVGFAFAAGSSFDHCSAEPEHEFDPRETLQSLVKALEKEHFLQLKIGDELSSKAFDLFIASLDPKRMYFLRSDIEEFEKHRQRFDDLARAGDLSFAKLARDRLRQRLTRAAEHAVEFAVADHDYTVDESYPLNFATFSADEESLRERWRLRLKAERMLERLLGRPRDEVEAQLAARYRRILDQARTMSDERLCELFLNSIARATGPNTAYLSESVLTWFRIGILRDYTLGFGVIEDRGSLRITRIMPGLRRTVRPELLIGWHLIALQTEQGEWIDLVEMPIHDASQIFKRDWGEVSLELFNPATGERVSLPWRSYLL